MRCEQIGNIRDDQWDLNSLFECRAKLYWHKKYKGSLNVGETPENPNRVCTLTFHHTKSCSKLVKKISSLIHGEPVKYSGGLTTRENFEKIELEKEFKQ